MARSISSDHQACIDVIAAQDTGEVLGLEHIVSA